MDKQPVFNIQIPSGSVVQTSASGRYDLLTTIIPVSQHDREKLVGEFERLIKILKSPPPRYTVSDIRPGDYIEYREPGYPGVFKHGPVNVPSNFQDVEILSVKRLFEVKPS
jgi:hypothetical protein